MTTTRPIFTIAISVACLGHLHAEEDKSQPLSTASPKGQISLNFSPNEQGAPLCSIDYKGRPLLLNSALVLKLKSDGVLEKDFSVSSSNIKSHDSTCPPLTFLETGVTCTASIHSDACSEGEEPETTVTSERILAADILSTVVRQSLSPLQSFNRRSLRLSL